MANSEDPDQTLHSTASDLSLPFFFLSLSVPIHRAITGYENLVHCINMFNAYHSG